MTAATPALRRTIRVGHSPDADDAFMFWGLATGRVETGDWRYVHHLEEIERLNDRATRGEYEVTAISLAAYPAVAERYALLGVGASVGEGYGPVLVVPAGATRPAGRLRVAVPGARTTAALALRLWARETGTEIAEAPMAFDAVQGAARSGEADAALLIHEGQLTYADEGFALVADLGAWWLERTGLPLPLGLNAGRRDLGPAGLSAVARHIRASVRLALENRAEALAHALRYARGLPARTADRFVGMYVNDETLGLSDRTREAARRLLGEAASAGLVPRVGVEFVEAGA